MTALTISRHDTPKSLPLGYETSDVILALRRGVRYQLQCQKCRDRIYPRSRYASHDSNGVSFDINPIAHSVRVDVRCHGRHMKFELSTDMIAELQAAAMMPVVFPEDENVLENKDGNAREQSKRINQAHPQGESNLVLLTGVDGDGAARDTGLPLLLEGSNVHGGSQGREG